MDKKVNHANNNYKKFAVAIVISDNVDCKTKIITRYKKDFIKINRSIHQKISSKYLREKKQEKQIDKCTILTPPFQ